MKTILILPVLFVILLGCADSLTEREEVVVADFEFEISGDCSTPVLEVLLQNKSTQVATYLWDFGDGTASNLENPKKVYAKSGQYVISLTVNMNGQTKSVEKKVTIIRNSDGTGPTGELIVNRLDNSLEFEFEVTSTADSVFFQYGDGNWHVPTSGLNFRYTFNALGTYQVYLLMKNQDGCTCDSEIINIDPFGG